MTHPLFLRWALGNSLAACGLVAIALAFVKHIHGAPLAVAVVIVTITAAASAYAGRLFWYLDWEDTVPAKAGARHIDAVIYTCQVLAALGAILGVYLTASSKSGGGVGLQAAVSGVLDAMSNGLLATFTGIVCSLVLFWEHHALTHVLDG